MTQDTLWDLFLATGLPEVYSLYHLAREEEEITEGTA